MYILGTAGHVDHGKSTLVKALTGIDPDRWAEEQRRQMTIDLGFAWRTLPSGRSISLVDVPGHERFIKNMLAGVGGIDAVLLVVAADEALMPQTLEHLAILDLLGIDQGIVVLTKADLVEPDWLALVADDVRATLHVSSLATAPLVSVSARTGAGLDTLLAAIDTLLAALPSRAVADGSPRLSIDRSFTVGGFGTVVTGTLVDGPLQLGDEVEILPASLRARVRGLQSHQQKLERALPGNRVAVNLAGVAHTDVVRGDLLIRPGALTITELVDIRLRLVSDLDQPLVQNAPLELFVGAAQTLCRATLLDSATLGAGESDWVQLRLAQPLALARGDRYIVRQPSPSRTVGGGVVIDPHPPRHRRFRPEVSIRLAALARGTPADLLRPAFEKAGPRAWADLLAETGLDEATAYEGASELLTFGEITAFDATIGWYSTTNHPVTLSHCHLFTTSGAQALREKLATVLRGYHRRYPLRQGIPREDVRSRLKLTGAALDSLLVAEVAAVRSNEHSAWLADHTPTPDAAQSRAIERLLAAYRAAPYNPPPPDIDQELLAFLIEQGKLARLDGELVVLAAVYHEWGAWVLQQVADEGTLTVIQFRDHFATSRRYALALLEHLDERKITRRVGDLRVGYSTSVRTKN